MSDDNKRNCGACIFWNQSQDGHMGYCQRNPPSVAAYGGSIKTMWPTTSALDFCGEFSTESLFKNGLNIELLRWMISSKIPPDRLEACWQIFKSLVDPQETSKLCLSSVRALINAFCWSPETEALCIEQMKPIAEKMHQLAVEFKEIMGIDDPPA